MKFKSINPYTLDELHEYESISDNALNQKLEVATNTFKTWRQASFESRAALMRAAARVLRDDKDDLARTITLEMGKSLKEAVAEVEKCAWACDYYAEHAAEFLAAEVIETTWDDPRHYAVEFSLLAGLPICGTRSDGRQRVRTKTRIECTRMCLAHRKGFYKGRLSRWSISNAYRRQGSGVVTH
jgi:hypothetical protein